MRVRFFSAGDSSHAFMFNDVVEGDGQMTDNRRRCPWAVKDPLSLQYHDTEWGIPLHDEQRLFSLLNLEVFQAGLSWSLILSKRSVLTEALDFFDPFALSLWDGAQCRACLEKPGMIRNERKVKAVVANAKAYLNLCHQEGGLDPYLWHWVDGQSIIHHWQQPAEVPTQTPLSEKISRDLKQRGFLFVGPIVCYSLMEAAGLVCDHLAWCDCHPDNLSHRVSNIK